MTIGKPLEHYLTFKEKRRKLVDMTIGKVKPIVEDWFLATGLKYMKENKLTLQEEDILEKISDYYLAALAKL